MTSSEIKEYIYENNKIEMILEGIECHHIVDHGDYISCGNIDGDNVGAINVFKNKYLNVIDYTRNLGDKSDIFTLIEYNLKKMNKPHKFKDSVIFVHNILHLDIGYTYIKHDTNDIQESILSVFTHAQSSKMLESAVNDDLYNEIDKIDFVPYVHIDFFREGIIKKTIEKFGLGYSFSRKRTIIPIRYWKNGKVIAYNMRSSVKNCEQFGIRKYMLTKGYHKQHNVYGYYENKKSINNSHHVSIFEAEKSVLKLDSYMDGTGLALSGHVLSNYQVGAVLKLDINEVTICMDKDVSILDVLGMCEKFYPYIKVSFIYDKNNVLGDKDSPIDKGINTYRNLYKNRIIYNEKWHEAYLNELNRGN